MKISQLLVANRKGTAVSHFAADFWDEGASTPKFLPTRISVREVWVKTQTTSSGTNGKLTEHQRAFSPHSLPARSSRSTKSSQSHASCVPGLHQVGCNRHIIRSALSSDMDFACV